MTDNTTTPGRLMEYLPGIYREDPALGQFLKAFEKVLLGRQDDDCTNEKVLQELQVLEELIAGIFYFFDPDKTAKKLQGLEELIAGISGFFDPDKTPKEFLPWLAGWVAFSLRADVDEKKQRKFIANMTELYRWRGTEKNLKQLFHIFTDREPLLPDMGDNAEAHYFKVSLDFSELMRGRGQSEEDRQKELQRQFDIAYALIELEKPAHTRYELDLIFPGFQIGSLKPLTNTQTQEPLTNFQTQTGINTRLGVANWSK